MNHQEIQSRLKDFPNWKLEEGKIRRDFEFPDFIQAFGFMSQVALHAEVLGHHPEWKNVYNRVTVELITHDAGPGVTDKDFALASKIDRCFT